MVSGLDFFPRLEASNKGEFTWSGAVFSVFAREKIMVDRSKQNKVRFGGVEISEAGGPCHGQSTVKAIVYRASFWASLGKTNYRLVQLAC